MNDKLERIWKEVVVTYFKVLPWHKGQRKTTKNFSKDSSWPGTGDEIK
jgi:hypothetical protein